MFANFKCLSLQVGIDAGLFNLCFFALSLFLFLLLNYDIDIHDIYLCLITIEVSHPLDVLPQGCII